MEGTGRLGEQSRVSRRAVVFGQDSESILCEADHVGNGGEVCREGAIFGG
jgi:hypothetical protein